MMKIKVYDLEGKTVSERELAPEVFDVKVNENLVHLAAETQAANARTSNQHTKTRGEVRGGGKKPWKQKGTGRARHGSIRSPIWVGGGVTFGPTPDRSYAKKMNRKTKKAVMAMALTDKARSESLVAVESLAVESGKTKMMAAVLAKLPIKRKVLIVLPQPNKMTLRSSRNLQRVRTVTVGDVSLLDLLKADTVIAPVATLDRWEKNYKK